jgi:hypothetical protein
LSVLCCAQVELHGRDVISELLDASKKGKVATTSFEWTRQLRFYPEKAQVRSINCSPSLFRVVDSFLACGCVEQGTEQWGRCQIRQTNTRFNYGYEYQV